MKIEGSNLLESLENRNVSREGTGIEAFIPQENSVSGYTSAFTTDIHKAGVSEKGTISGNDLTYEKPETDNPNKKKLADQLEKDSQLDMETRRNQMAVLSNTVSPEDYKEMQEQGFTLSETDSATMVTVVDKIKVNMAETGADVDLSNLNQETIEAVTGNKDLSQQIYQSLQEADLPTSQQNVKEISESLEELKDLDSLSQEGMSYLLKNGMEPTITNTYLAEHSGSSMSTISMEAASSQYQELEAQIQTFLEENGFAVDQEGMTESKWLLANDIPLNEENLSKLKKLEEIGVTLKENGGVDLKDALSTITQTIQKGKRPGDTGLEEITQLRQKEETRLKMTADANLTNEKKGMDRVELSPIEERVSSLKEEEEAFYTKLLKSGMQKNSQNNAQLNLQSNVEATGDSAFSVTDDMKEKARIGAETTLALEDLKQAPAALLDKLSKEQDLSLEEIHMEGQELASTYKKAGEGYETMMTAPRSDLGDSIKKAFQNVDDILTDLKLETNDSNRRAVRILAYNQTEINTDNIEKVKAADLQMQRTFKAMTPSVTLEMIRRNENPLEMNLTKLNQEASQISQELGTNDERFSKFLWKLEQKQDITKEERESFVGIYRLITQVEKSDGAALGSLLNQGGEMTMKNLLTAVRNKKKGPMEYTIDDNFQGVNGSRQNQAIDDQINTAFIYQKNCLTDLLENLDENNVATLQEANLEDMTPEEIRESLLSQEISQEEKANSKQLDLEYSQSQLELVTEAAEADSDIYSILDRFDMPNTPINLLAASEMLRKPNAMFDTLFQQNKEGKTEIEQITDLKNQVLEEFGEALKNPEELAEAENTLAQVAENAMKSMIIEKEDISSQDILELQKMCKQFTLCAKKTSEESFVIPIETTDGVSGVNLKVVRGDKNKGWVDILFEGAMMGKISASFQAKENRVSGMIAVDNQDTRQLISDNLGMIASIFQEDGGEAMDLSVAYVPDMDYEKALRNQLLPKSVKTEALQAQNSDNKIEPEGLEQNQVQTKRLYHIAESFIQTLKELNNDGSIF